MEATLASSLGRTTLSSGTLNIGRASDNQLVVDDPQASTHHAEIKPSSDETAYLVADLNSTNGTFVNEERLPVHTPRVLNTGDVIRIGSIHFTYEIANATYVNEPTVAASSPGYEPTVAAMPDAFSSYTADVPQAQSAQPSSARADDTAPPALPDYPAALPAASPSDFTPSPGRSSLPQQARSRIGLWITLALVGVAVIVAIIWGGSLINRPTPTETLQTFCTDLKNSDAQGLYDLLSSRARAETSVDRLKTFLGLIQLAGGIRDCAVGNVQESGSTATGNVAITLNNGRAGQPTPVRLINEEGAWKMDSSLGQDLG